MPTYEYICENCGSEFERFQSITARALRKCPDCGKFTLKRLVGTGAGIIFRGSGFYQTDYRSQSYKEGEKSEKKAADTGTSKDKSKTKNDDSKSTGKTKPDAKGKKKSADTKPPVS
ncbi:MAG: FmdB family zinc ribbon protein [Planctomycetota bacterium]|jgi:putative FmdB family regulatory protein